MKTSIEQAVNDPGHSQTQAAGLRRCFATLATDVIDFCHLTKGSRFHMRELEAFVAKRAGICSVVPAPGSAGRVLRDLHKQGKVQYQVIDRNTSLYRINKIAPEKI